MDYIVILERTSVNPPTISFVMRADVPAARQAFYADAAKTSAYKGILAADLTALRAGQVIEKTDSFGYGGMTLAQIKTALIAKQAAFQADVTADAEYNPFKFYGSRWDKTAWTAGGVS
jgi:hypothetical protein